MKEKYSTVLSEALTFSQNKNLFENNKDIKNYLQTTERINSRNKKIDNKKNELLLMLMNNKKDQESNKNLKCKSLYQNNLNTNYDSTNKIKNMYKNFEKMFDKKSGFLSNRNSYNCIVQNLLGKSSFKLNKNKDIKDFEEFKKGL